MLSPDEQPALGLRERKKARTRAAIQRHALRLFREQGYDATTVSQIAEAAEVSESTFFRYFPSKEDVALWDEFDPMFLAVLAAQPPEVGPIAAMRAAAREVFGQLSQAEVAEVQQRIALVLSVPELRAASLDQIGPTMRLFARGVAERTGRPPDDVAVLTLVGAVFGVLMAAMFAAADTPDADLFGLMDRALAQLEAGLPL